MNELEAKLNQIADSLLVQSRLVDRFERRTEERFASHEDRLDRIEAALEKVTDGHVRLVESHQRMIESHQRMIESQQSLIESHQDLASRQAQTEAALQALIKQIDRFLRGQQSNGHE
jgi:t-SNARE complex subunit (syntaxin)